MATVDLLNVSVQLSATLAQAFPNGAAGVLQVLGHMSSIPPGAGVHHGSVAVPLWKPKQHLSGTSSDTRSQQQYRMLFSHDDFRCLYSCGFPSRLL